MGVRVVSVLLDESRILFYRTADVLDAESIMKKSIRQAVVEPSITDVVTMLWAGLRHQNEKLTTADVTKILDTAKRVRDLDTFSLWNTVVEALVASGILPPARPPGESAPAVPPVAPVLAPGSIPT